MVMNNSRPLGAAIPSLGKPALLAAFLAAFLAALLVAPAPASARNPTKGWEKPKEFTGSMSGWPFTDGPARAIEGDDAPDTSGPDGSTLPYQGKVLLRTGEDVLEEEFEYPRTGDARVTSMLVSLAPGELTPVQTLESPVLVHVLEGEVTMLFGRQGWKSIKAGESILQPMRRPMRSQNKGDRPARLLVVIMGAEGSAEAMLVKE